jgi:NAD(P)-dependent dehydrogenase (short-subunit alcohol dehydrogenase family)
MSHLEHLPHVTLLTLDVTSGASIAAAVEAVRAQTGGKLDYLVNNAGAWYIVPLLDTDIEQGKRIFDVNLWGVIAVTQAFAPLMMAGGGGGRIVNISSVAGAVRAPWASVYGASKLPSPTWARCCASRWLRLASRW